MSFSEYPIHIDQICIGLFIKSEAGASETLRKGLKIKNNKQIEAIKRSGMTHVTCILNKSDSLPIPIASIGNNKGVAPEAGSKQKTPVSAAPQKENGKTPMFKTPVSKELLGLKQETLERNKERKKRFAKCEKNYDASVGAVAALLRRVSGRSEEAARQAGEVVDGLVDTFLSERDVLVNLISTKPKEEKGHYHALNVTVLSMMIGKELGFDGKTMHALGMGALFHDVGKGRMPISELSRGKATSMKYAVQKYYEQHPVMGAKIAADMPDFPRLSLKIILQHHETLNGQGFPSKLAGNEIIPLARIVSLVNLYDNLCNKNDPNESYTPHETLKYIFSNKKKELDNRILALFIRSIGIYPPGTVVQLSNGLLGMVVSTNINKSTRPSVMIYHPEIPKKEALLIDLAVEEDLEIRKTLHPDELQRQVFSYLSPSRQVMYYADNGPGPGSS